MHRLRQQKDALPLAEDRRSGALENFGQSGADPAGLRIHHGQREAGPEPVQGLEVPSHALSRSGVQTFRRTGRCQVLQERLPHS